MGGMHACVNTQSEDLSDAEADHATTLSVSEEKLFLDPDLFQGDRHTGASPPEEIAVDRSVSEPSGSFYHGTDLNTAISAFLSNCDDHQLFRLTSFYMERLEQAIEEGVEGVSFMLMGEDHFTGPEYHSVTELAEKGNRAGASKLLLDLVMEKGSGARKVMWESFVKLNNHLPKLSRILNEIRERGDGQFAYMDTERGLSEVPKHLKVVQQKHKETLRAQTETLRVNTILMREKVKVFQLVDRYAELTVISTVRDQRLVEHELLARGRDHEEWREKHLRTELEKIRADQLFQRSFHQKLKRSFFRSQSGMSAAVAGVPGIGKTTMIHKIVYDWATGKIYQQFQFVFSFKFRDLNSINCRISLKELILHQYPYFGNILGEIWKQTEGLLFIFDGLDEFKDEINFVDCRRDTKSQYTDPEFKCKLSEIVHSLIQGNLLPGCSVLVTTRPTALHLLEKAKIAVWAEILGFVGEEQKEYFIRHFEDQTVAAAVFKHVQENEIMYTMSYNPSYCWILALALGPFFTQKVRNPQRVPKTITQLYSYYIYNILKNHGREIENPRDVLLRVGQMAFRGVSEKKIVFTDGDLIKFNLKPSQFLSGFLMEHLERFASARSVVYTFPHLTIQEFVAAVAQFLNPHPGDILKFLTEVHSTTDERFEVFLRFVAGLSSSMTARGLEEFLGPFPHQTTCRVIDWVKEEVKRQIGNTWSDAGKRSFLNTLHYLFESQNSGLAQAALGSVETLSFSGMTLTPIDCADLSHVIGLCDTIKHLKLAVCNIQCVGMQRLGPGLHRCQGMRPNMWRLHGHTDTKLLTFGEYPGASQICWDELGDSGMKPVSAALRNPECKVQKLDGAADLASALSTNPSLTELDLSYNELGDSGVKLVSAALRNPECKIQKLEIDKVGLTDSGVEDLASALSTNPSLIELSLSSNELGDSGVKLVSAALKNPECKIQKLELNHVGLTDSGAVDLVSTLRTNRLLTELNVSENELRDSGVKLVSAALRNPECKMQTLGLRDVGLTDSGAEDLVSALSTNPSLTELDLSDNKLGDSGVKLVSADLGNPECKIQKLELKKVGLTDSGAEHLVSALSPNRSLTELNLGINSLTDRSAPALCRLILTLPNLEWIRLVGNRFSETREKELRLVQDQRPGLIVIL
ncbi:NACHT, LRR and PYD domains-containing protein 12-like [Hypanus sabinus]|uniref:NACHT, LRR and PYD domains-containing protein 12-like n=1 Tax=Hypanus sabinus TaxID=79690 RepID=UPI0028C4EDCF|nr:NACHT, LRR and PYD domains-containing protein 12-like [Hypanus sabinus]